MLGKEDHLPLMIAIYKEMLHVLEQTRSMMMFVSSWVALILPEMQPILTYRAMI